MKTSSAKICDLKVTVVGHFLSGSLFRKGASDSLFSEKGMNFGFRTRDGKK